MNHSLAVEIKHLTKNYNGIEVIKGCSMSVPEGSIYGFLGPNGAGKTTVFKLISGLITPDMGTIRICGKDISKNKNEILKNIGCIIETPIFYEHLSATENLEIHLSYMGRTQYDNIEVTLNRVGLNNTGKQPVSRFSLGMRQRLAIARAIIHKPKILILDEPINGLDPMGIREMRLLFTDLVQKDNVTLLISSHILSEIEQLADIICVIVNGTIVEEELLSDIREKNYNSLEDYILELLSGGQND